MSIALSGMRASAVRVSNSANNIANAESTSVVKDGIVSNQPFLPQDVVQISDQNGGAIAYTQPSDAQPISTYDPTSGVTQLPNVDIASELVNTQQAAVNYSANLKILSTSSSLLSSLVNILA